MSKSEDVEILKRALSRERAARKSAEQILEKKSEELFAISEKLKSTNLQLENLLEEKSSQLEGIFENINDAYLVIDLDGNILKMNDVAKYLFGYNQDEIENFRNLIYTPDKKYTKDSFETLKNVGFLNNYTARIITKRGSIKWVQINATLVINKVYEPIAVQGIVRDITQIKKLEIQKEKILKDLEISNEQLQEYAHIVSHDLKSPLRSINALISWIKEDNIDNFDEKTKMNFSLIEDTLETMDTMISNILEYATVGANIDKKLPVNLNEVVEELKKVLFIPKHIYINIVKKLPTIKGDKTKFTQLFQSLLSNAVKFIDKDQGFININYVEYGDFYKFSIEDNGIGIDKKYHQKIFEVFQTLHQTKESSGIGLSIVKKIVNLYQGDIWLESKPNIGSKFIFTLKK